MISKSVLALAVLLVFFGLYLYIAEGCMRQVMIYFLLTAGLYFSISWVYAAVLTNSLGLLLLVIDGTHQWPLTSAGLALMLICTAVIPFYYDSLSRRSRVEFRKNTGKLRQKTSELENELINSEKARSTLEEEIEKINQLYILGRELVEYMELEDVLDHLQRILLNRPGVSNVAVFLWEKNSWKALSCSDAELREKLLFFMSNHKQLKLEKGIKLLQAPDFLPEKSLVFWPIRLEKDLMAGILITADEELAPRYVEEGGIFIPQIALGLKRTRLFAEVRDRSRVDGLTGLYLRRYFLERLQTEIQRAKRYSGVFSLILLDLDFFKKVNDTYGHIVGDKVLCGVSRIFIDCVRPGDLVGRYGGEEFIILVPMSSVEEVRRIADDILKIVAKKEFTADNEKFNVTISAGISHYPQDGASLESLLASADQVLYWVKTNGRNAVKDCGDINPAGKKKPNKQRQD